MELSTEASVLAALEQAEMAARERRLAASNEAEGIASAARQRASAISAQADRRVDETLDELRHAVEADADAAIEDLERIAARRSSSSPSQGQADPSAEQAVAVVVAHVLGEAISEADDEERA